ncbi:pH regulation protein F [Paracoccus liaowanqingii]|uniref:pH regulation protein F n=1 Tax=Paracoccus liaowanqingii TaxID=2560053 RepID=A0A4P7HKV6_9RHOB|nr:monovalent cation/H+ antiporter complex subunit F [Paracoccus liaowanqingii]QBX34829.1 pH regulation protein F [Paracoccus liaowanqingii]TGN61925.1 pH regulation protein F [Paracoccus liaowanqingii]
MTVLDYAILLGFVLVILGVTLATIRLVIGPTLADRIVALDMMTVQLVAFGGLAALQARSAAFLDVAVVLALVGFLATVCLARYLERRILLTAEELA